MKKIRWVEHDDGWVELFAGKEVVACAGPEWVGGYPTDRYVGYWPGCADDTENVPLPKSIKTPAAAKRFLIRKLHATHTLLDEVLREVGRT